MPLRIADLTSGVAPSKSEIKAKLAWLLSQGLIHIRSPFPACALTIRPPWLSSGLAALDAIIDGGIMRGRVSEIVGPIGSGRTTVAAGFVAAATQTGEVSAWIEGERSFAPAAIAASSARLERVLWASMDDRANLCRSHRADCAATVLSSFSRRLN